MNNNNLFSRTVKAGLITGTLDILAACARYFIKTGKGPKDVLTYIASAAFGKEAFPAGNKMMLYGLLLHFIIAYVFTLFFFLLFPNLYAATRNKIIISILYGVFMWATMKWLVLPLSSAPRLTETVMGAIVSILILIACIGIPLSFMAAKFYTKRL